MSLGRSQDASHVQSVIFKMSLVVIVWPLGSKTRQTSKIRRDSENWVILGHTPKLPKIIDRRNVQVYNNTDVFAPLPAEIAEVWVI